jgi:hypothetical protein
MLLFLRAAKARGEVEESLFRRTLSYACALAVAFAPRCHPNPPAPFADGVRDLLLRVPHPLAAFAKGA